MTLVRTNCEGGRPLHSVAQLVDLDATPELLVFVADELDQLLIGQIALVDANGPWLRVGLRIFERRIDLQVAERGAPNALSELRFPAIRAAIDVEPSVVGTLFGASQVVRFDNEGIAVPRPNRVAVPPRLRLALRRKLAAIE